MNHFALILLLVPAAAFAAESSFTLPALSVTAKPSFETLREESLVPTTSIPIDASRSTLLDGLKWDTQFPLQNFGFPSGANGVSLGGRSIDDTQVTTLGVPLNQAIGGGADLSAFPAFLWSDVRIAPTTTSAAFIQQSASGNLDLTPWSWSALRSEIPSTTPSRLTASWDRDLQTVSIGTRKSEISILAGSTFGRQTGPSGSLSYRFLKTPVLSLSANVIGSDQKGDDPGSTLFPRPMGSKKTTRVIPSLMGQYGNSNGIRLQTTIFGDIQRLEFTNPVFNTLDQTRSLGIENVLVTGDTSFSVSARNVNFTNNSAGTYSEWPAHFGVTQGFNLPANIRLKATGSAEYLSGYGLHPGARVSSEIPAHPGQSFFLEAQALAKLPSIQDRLYVSPADGYFGNPNVKPERVYAFIAGFEDKSSWIESKSQIKAELRNNVILLKDDFSSVDNAGTAQFLSLSESAKAKLLPELQVKAQVLASYSRLAKTGNPYPRLPVVSAGGSILLLPQDRLTFETQAKWMGRSTEFNGASLPAFLLLGEKISFSATNEIQIHVGVDNLLDSRIEMIRGYPLPGRMVYASTEIIF